MVCYGISGVVNNKNGLTYGRITLYERLMCEKEGRMTVLQRFNEAKLTGL